MDHFIMHLPEWDNGLVFSRETLLFLLTVILVAVGLLFCFQGYRYFQSTCFVALGGVVLYFAYQVMELLTSSRALLLILSVTMTFFGMCFIYFLFVIVHVIFDKLHIRQGLNKNMHIISAAVGGILLTATVYYGIYDSIWIALAVGVTAGVLGLLVQRRGMKKTVRYKTYHDLMKMKLPDKYADLPDWQEEEDPEPVVEQAQELPDVQETAPRRLRRKARGRKQCSLRLSREMYVWRRSRDLIDWQLDGKAPGKCMYEKATQEGRFERC